MAGEARNGRDVRASVEPVRDSSDATAAERRHRELAFARPAAHLREPPRHGRRGPQHDPRADDPPG